MAEFADEKVLWKDRRRRMGMPLSFMRYEVTEDRFITRTGFFKTETNEILLYRILDIKLVRTLWQKIFRVGTITLFSADQSHAVIELKNIKKPEAVRKFLSRIIEQERNQKGITGREIYGAAGMRMQGDGNGYDFTDTDGDGIPE